MDFLEKWKQSMIQKFMIYSVIYFKIFLYVIALMQKFLLHTEDYLQKIT